MGLSDNTKSFTFWEKDKKTKTILNLVLVMKIDFPWHSDAALKMTTNISTPDRNVWRTGKNITGIYGFSMCSCASFPDL